MTTWTQIPSPIDSTHPGYDSQLLREIREEGATLLALDLDEKDHAESAHVRGADGEEWWVTDHGAGPGAWREVAPWDDDDEGDEGECDE